MKRRLTLAIGCLACAMPSVAAALSPQSARSSAAPSHLAQKSARTDLSDLSDLSDQSPQTPVSNPVHNSPLTLPHAAQLAQHELDTRGLTPSHSIASIVFLKSAGPATGHYDIRIEPPATLADGTRLRGFSIALDGALLPTTDFRAVIHSADGTGAPLSTQIFAAGASERGLASGEQAG